MCCHSIWLALVACFNQKINPNLPQVYILWRVCNKKGIQFGWTKVSKSDCLKVFGTGIHMWLNNNLQKSSQTTGQSLNCDNLFLVKFKTRFVSYEDGTFSNTTCKLWNQLYSKLVHLAGCSLPQVFLDFLFPWQIYSKYCRCCGYYLVFSVTKCTWFITSL